MTVMIQRCTRCDNRWFPDRLMCPSCGEKRFAYDEASDARVVQVTTLADETRIASVTAFGQVPMIARLVGAANVGDIVRLTAGATDAGPAALVPISSNRARKTDED